MGEFIRLLGAYFTSQVGSHLLTLALASHVLVVTGSLMRSALVFVFSFLPSVLVSGWIGGWIDRRASRSLYVGNECLAIGGTLLCGWLAYTQASPALLCVALAGRSILGFVSRSLAMKWIKEISPLASQAKRFKLFSLAFFMATALSGALASVVLGRYGLKAVVGLDVATYLLGALGLLTLPRWRTAGAAVSAGQNFSETFRLVFSQVHLGRLALVVVFSQAIFQGAYSVLVTLLPLRRFGLGLDGVGAFQLAASAGILLGFAFLWIRPAGLDRGERGLWVGLLTVVALLLAISAPSPVLSWWAFFGLHLGYELLWLSRSSELFRQSPAHATGRIQFFVASLGATAMSAVTLLYAALIPAIGLFSAFAVVLAVAITAVALVRASRRPNLSVAP